MKKNSLNKVLAALIAICALVAIFVMYAPAFADKTYQASTGSFFHLTFGSTDAELPVIVPFVIAFVCLLLVVLFALAVALLSGKSLRLAYLVELLLGAGAGIIPLFGIQIYDSYHPTNTLELLGEAQLGSGSICVIVFSFLAAAIAFLGLATTARKED